MQIPYAVGFARMKGCMCSDVYIVLSQLFKTIGFIFTPDLDLIFQDFIYISRNLDHNFDHSHLRREKG